MPRKRFLRSPTLDVHTEHGQIDVTLHVTGERFVIRCERGRGKWLVYWDAPQELMTDDIYTVEDR